MPQKIHFGISIGFLALLGGSVQYVQNIQQVIVSRTVLTGRQLLGSLRVRCTHCVVQVVAASGAVQLRLGTQSTDTTGT